MPNRLSQAIAVARKAVADRAEYGASATPVEAGLPETVAILAVGRAATDPVEAALAFAEGGERAGRRVLLITSDSRVVEQRIPEFTCEYLAPAAELAEATGDGPEVVRLYQIRRLRIMLEKWLVTECRWLGDVSSDLVDMAQSEPGFARIRFQPLS